MSTAAPSSAGEARVLVVEDDRHICELLAEALEAEGIASRCVSTDREAHDALKTGGRFGCIIVDINLGTGTTGFDVARFARRLDPKLAVIYVSGQTSEASFNAFGVRGSLFLPKPFLPSELLDRVRTLTDQVKRKPMEEGPESDCAARCRELANQTYALADKVEFPSIIGDYLEIAAKLVRCAEAAERGEPCPLAE